MLGDGYSHVVVAPHAPSPIQWHLQGLGKFGVSLVQPKQFNKTAVSLSIYILLRPPRYVEHVEFNLSCTAKYCILFFSSFRVHLRSHLSFPLLLALTSTPNPLSVFSSYLHPRTPLPVMKFRECVSDWERKLQQKVEVKKKKHLRKQRHPFTNSYF